MEKEGTNSKTEVITMDNGEITKWMEKEIFFLLMKL
jgi:hypothetical protein